MTLDDRIQGLRLRVMARAQALGSVSAACREAGISHTVFYYWRRRVECYGPDGLHPRRQQARPGRKSQVAPPAEYGVAGVRWSSSAPDVVMVSAEGPATAAGERRATVTAALGDEHARATLELTASAPRPAEVVDVLPPEGSRIVVLPSCPPGFACPAAEPSIPFGADVSLPDPEQVAAIRLLVDGRQARGTSDNEAPGSSRQLGGLAGDAWRLTAGSRLSPNCPPTSGRR